MTITGEEGHLNKTWRKHTVETWPQADAMKCGVIAWTRTDSGTNVKEKRRIMWAEEWKL